MQTIRACVLIAATMTMGLIAGAFALYAHTIMPGLASTDDRTFIAAFQAIDRAIINPWFMAGGFLGALGLTVLAAVTNRGRPALVWIGVALLLYVIAVVVTIAIHVPLNDAIKAAGDPHQIANPAIIRRNFQQTRWVAWNLVRVVTSITASGCLCWALVLHGRSTG